MEGCLNLKRIRQLGQKVLSYFINYNKLLNVALLEHMKPNDGFRAIAWV